MDRLGIQCRRAESRERGNALTYGRGMRCRRLLWADCAHPIEGGVHWAHSIGRAHTRAEAVGGWVRMTWCMLIGTVMRASPNRVVIVSHPCAESSPFPSASTLPLSLLLSVAVPLPPSAICTVLWESNYSHIIFFSNALHRKSCH